MSVLHTIKAVLQTDLMVASGANTKGKGEKVAVKCIFPNEMDSAQVSRLNLLSRAVFFY